MAKNIHKKKACLRMMYIGAAGAAVSLLCRIFTPGTGVTFLVEFLAVCFGVLCVYGLAGVLEQRGRLSRVCRIFRRAVQLGFVCFLSSFIVIECFVLSAAGGNIPGESPNYILVLGAGLDGSRPSAILGSRIDAAVEAMKRFPKAKAIVSGGQGPGEDVTEASVMFELMTQAGIAPERIIVEDRSTDTDENFINSIELAELNDGLSIMVVSNGFHLLRARLIGEKYGLSVYAYPAKTPFWWLDLTYFIREYFGMGKYYLHRIIA